MRSFEVLPLPRKNDANAVSIWQVQQIRLTVFISPSARLEGQDWWRDVVEAPPLNRSVQQGIIFRDDGIVQGNQLALAVNPSRVDWVLTAGSQGSIAEGTSPTTDLGPWQEVLPMFEGLMLKWFKQSPPATRVAFGATLVAYTNTPREGYDILADYLPSVNVDFDKGRDFSFQINRPRPSQVNIPGLVINRLSQWAAIYLDTYQFSSDGVVNPPFRRHAARLNMDINSSPEYEGELPLDQLPELFAESIGLAEEIIVNGDIS